MATVVTVRRYLSSRAAETSRGARAVRDVAWATYGAIRLRSAFDQVERYCMFIGYPRSGHSLVGNLLNAHENVVIAQELNALRYVRRGFPRAMLFALLLRRDQRFGKAGRVWAGYEFEVPNQHQGSFTELRVIGDKRGGTSTERLARDPSELDLLKQRIRVPIRFIHIVRNPYDNVATIANRGDGDIEAASRLYLRLVEANAALLESEGDSVMTLRHEDFVRSPQDGLRLLCQFLDVDPSPAYLNDAAGIVFEQPRQTRDSVRWEPEIRQRIDGAIDRHAFLTGYRFED